MDRSDDFLSEDDAAWLASVLGEWRERFATAVRQAALEEREACARLAESKGAAAVAAAIRAWPTTAPAPTTLFPADKAAPEARPAIPLPPGGKPLTLLETGPGAVPFPGQLIDYSDGGLGILVHRQVARGSQLIVRPAQAIDSAPAAQLAVRYCISTGSGWRVGCQLGDTPRRVVMTLLGLSPPSEPEA